MLRAGDVIGNRYVAERPLGSGGQSHVTLIRSIHEPPGTGARWIAKEVRTDGAFDALLAGDMLAAEADVLKRLEHPGLMRVDDLVSEGGKLYMIAAYVPGKTLEETLQERGPLPEDEVVGIGLQLCDILGYLHSRRHTVIHRDLKPANIILCADGRVVLIDFGTALMRGRMFLTDRTAMGTRGYAAPEQYGETDKIGDAADVYALGKTLTALATGGNTAVRDKAALSAPLLRVLKRCTRRGLHRRYRTVAEVYVALRHVREPGTPYRSFLRLVSGNGDEVRDARASARRNGAFRIGPDMPTGRVASYREIEVPLDDPDTEVRLGMDDNSVNVVRMKGFHIERDVMVTRRENYRLEQEIQSVSFYDMI